jgi:hypothetical protein
MRVFDFLFRRRRERHENRGAGGSDGSDDENSRKRPHDSDDEDAEEAKKYEKLRKFYYYDMNPPYYLSKFSVNCQFFLQACSSKNLFASLLLLLGQVELALV